MNAITQYDEQEEKLNEQPELGDERFTLSCEECDAEFDPWDVTRSIVNQETALYTCPNCSATVRGRKPYLRYRPDDE